MKLNTLLPWIRTFELPLGSMLFDIIFFVIIGWFLYRGLKKGISSLYWLGGNVIGMVVLMKVFNITTSSVLSDAITSNIDLDTIPLPLDVVLSMAQTAVGIIMATFGLLFLNIILIIVYQFVKKKIRLANKNMPKRDSKIIGGVAGAALGVFVAMSLTTTLYVPLWADYYEEVDSSISVKLTSNLQKSIYGTERTISPQTINSMITSINLLNNAEATMGDSFDAILDILEQADKDPILGEVIESIVDGAIESDLVPSLDITPGIDVETAYSDLVNDIFGEDSTLTAAEKITRLNELFDFSLDSAEHDHIPAFGTDTANNLACKLLTNEDATPVVKPAACA